MMKPAETAKQRADRVAAETAAIDRIRQACEMHASGAASFRKAMELIADVMAGEADRVVRVGLERHTPEMRT